MIPILSLRNKSCFVIFLGKVVLQFTVTRFSFLRNVSKNYRAVEIDLICNSFFIGVIPSHYITIIRRFHCEERNPDSSS